MGRSRSRNRNRNGIITTHVGHADVGVAHADYLYLYLSTYLPSRYVVLWHVLIT
jgi:hypothetical protein